MKHYTIYFIRALVTMFMIFMIYDMLLNRVFSETTIEYVIQAKAKVTAKYAIVMGDVRDINNKYVYMSLLSQYLYITQFSDHYLLFYTYEPTNNNTTTATTTTTNNNNNNKNNNNNNNNNNINIKEQIACYTNNNVGRASPWCKLLAINHSLALNEFDIILWMDTDSFIHTNLSIPQLVDYYKSVNNILKYNCSDCQIYFASDRPWKADPINPNSGTMFIKNSNLSKQFIEEWWNTNDKDYNYKHTFEQHILTDKLYNKYPYICTLNITTMDSTMWNSSLIIHFTNDKIINKFHLMEQHFANNYLKLFNKIVNNNDTNKEVTTIENNGHENNKITNIVNYNYFRQYKISK